MAEGKPNPVCVFCKLNRPKGTCINSACKPCCKQTGIHCGPHDHHTLPPNEHNQLIMIQPSAPPIQLIQIQQQQGFYPSQPSLQPYYGQQQQAVYIQPANLQQVQPQYYQPQPPQQYQPQPIYANQQIPPPAYQDPNKNNQHIELTIKSENKANEKRDEVDDTYVREWLWGCCCKFPKVLRGHGLSRVDRVRCNVSLCCLPVDSCVFSFLYDYIGNCWYDGFCFPLYILFLLGLPFVMIYDILRLLLGLICCATVGTRRTHPNNDNITVNDPKCLNTCCSYSYTAILKSKGKGNTEERYAVSRWYSCFNGENMEPNKQPKGPYDATYYITKKKRKRSYKVKRTCQITEL